MIRTPGSINAPDFRLSSLAVCCLSVRRWQAIFCVVLMFPFCLTAKDGVPAENSFQDDSTDPGKHTVQTFRGRVLDAFTGLPLPGASILILETDPPKGTATNADGQFRIDNLPLGRFHIKVSMLGYRPQLIQNLLLSAGRELVMDLRLEEQVYLLQDVIIRPEQRKDQPINEMAMVSARSFTVEETERYAGSLGDPSRMAANFAGVSSVSDQRNDIIIRGNSPIGLLWRLEGVDIPNPNHFGSLGSSGGPVSMLNNNLLANSDFYTGAFPAEYGNALAGAFDLRMRNGNNQRHEFMGQVGFNGFELGAEGPLSSQHKASYLANFRFSTLEVLSAAGMSFGTGEAIPKYKDLSFKLNFPLKNGRVSVFGLGGNNHIAMLDSRNDDAQDGFSGTDLYYDNAMGVLGASWLHYLGENAWFTSQISVSGISGATEIFELSDSQTRADIIEQMAETAWSISSKYSHRFDSRNYLNTGIEFRLFDHDYRGKQWHNATNQYRHYLDNEGQTGFTRAFVEWRHRFSDNLSVTSGLHLAYLGLNNSSSAEPRLGIKWEFPSRRSLYAGMGLHSQMQMRALYFSQSLMDEDLMIYQRTNQHLDFSRSIHWVMGYEQLLGEGHRLKTEVYYQYLYNIPVSRQRPEFSVLNQGAGFSFMVFNHMQNTGTGENKGLEITLEKFLHQGFYYLLTASVFDAAYRGYDQIWRPSAFSNNFVFNALSGYEFNLGKRSMLAIDLKMIYAGGSRYLPIDEQASLEAGATRYHWDQAYQNRFPDYFRLNGRISFRLNGRSIDQVWAIDLQNITNHSNIVTQNWNNYKGEITTAYQMGFMPMMTYRIYF